MDCPECGEPMEYWPEGDFYECPVCGRDVLGEDLPGGD
jgi:hypothetical protein